MLHSPSVTGEQQADKSCKRRGVRVDSLPLSLWRRAVAGKLCTGITSMTKFYGVLLGAV